MTDDTQAELRALDLFERLLGHPGNQRFRDRLLRRETADVMACLARLEAGHAARGAMPTEYLPLTPASAIAPPPERVGPFRLTERIGMGGMGDVWRAEREDGLFDQTVAIKLIHANLDTGARDAFDAERRILARLDHPGIVRLTDGGVTEGGRPYLVMDHVDGVPMDQAVANLPVDQRVRLFLRVAEAVQAAHGKLVAHGDLKPSNVMVDHQGRVHLLDFGIAAMLGAEGAGTTPRVSGAMTRAFASPQRRAGAPPSIADDVYALGRVLDGVLQGDGDADLDAVCAKAAAPDEADRYPTVAALADDLSRWLANLPVKARDGGFRYRAGKYFARHRFGVMASVAALTALLGTTTYATISSIRAERARAEATARFDDARGTARYLLFTLMDRLESQPRSLALREEVAKVAQHYLDRLSKGQDADPAVRLEAARGMIRLAEAQGVPGYQNIGQPDLAKANLERAIAMLGGKPASQQGATLAATALIARARIASFIDNDPAATKVLLDRAEPLLQRLPDNRILWARLFIERSAAHGWKSEYPPAIANARKALTLMDAPDSVEAWLEKAKAQDVLAEAIFYHENAGAAVVPYQAAMNTFAEGHRRFPQSRVLMQRLSRARWALGSTLLAVNRNREALAHFETGLVEVRAMMAFDPDDLETARLSQILELDRANALADTGQVALGLAALASNVEDRRAWLARRPQEVRRLRDLSVGVKALGDLRAKYGQTRLACTSYAEFRELVRQMKKVADFSAMDLENTATDLARKEAEYCPDLARHKNP